MTRYQTSGVRSQISEVRDLKSDIRHPNRGAAALTLVLLLGGLVVEIGLVWIFIFYLVNFTNYGIRVSGEALAAAQAGVEDGLLRLARNRCLPLPSPVQFAVGSAGVNVTIAGGVGCTGTMTRTITAVGERFTKKRKLEAVTEVNADTGAVRLVSVREVALP